MVKVGTQLASSVGVPTCRNGSFRLSSRTRYSAFALTIVVQKLAERNDEISVGITIRCHCEEQLALRGLGNGGIELYVICSPSLLPDRSFIPFWNFS